MSMQYWPRTLAQRLEDRLGYKHEMASLPDDQLGSYLERRLAPIAIQDFLIGVSSVDLEVDSEIETEELE